MAPLPDSDRPQDPGLDSDLDRALRDVLSKTEMSPHPKPETLVAYQEGRLTADAAAEVRSHLVRCRSCAREILDLAAFDGPVPDDPALQATEEELDRMVATARGTPRTPDDRPEDVRRGWPPPSTRLLSLGGLAAAALVFAVVGALLWGWLIGGHGGPELSRPFIADLAPSGSTFLRGSAADGAQLVEPPAFADSLALRLNLADPGTYRRYRLTIHTETEAAVPEETAQLPYAPTWSRSDLQPQPQGNFSVLVPRRDVPNGAYRLELSGLRGGGAELVATYRMRVRYRE